MSLRKKYFPWVVIFLLLASLTLACSDSADEPASSQATAQQEQATPVQEEPTEIPVKATAKPKKPKATKTATSTSSEGEGTIVADLGFRPELNGFSFENYGNESKPEDLTAAEIQRMFGDQVCASFKGKKCILTPPGKAWMKQTNQDMDGGHCEGMAALSLLMYAGKVPSNTFGGREASDLPFDNKDLQREIAYWWSTQTVDPTYTATIYGTPDDILKVLLKMSPGSKETYTIGIFKRDGSGGHAITPFAVEDLGGGKYAVLVYDNNYPKTTRRLYIDKKADTWSYEASTNPEVEPELYEGDAETQSLSLTPSSVRLKNQVCPFCEDSGSSRAGSGMAELASSQQTLNFNQVYLDGEGNLLIQDEQDHRLGYVDGKLVQEIPNARAVMYRMDASGDTPEPLYLVPEEQNLAIQIDGSSLTAESPSDLVVIGPGYSLGVEGISLDPGQVDTVYVFPGDEILSYDTDKNESPNIVVDIAQPGKPDYSFEIQGVDMKGGGTITVVLDKKAGDLMINTEKLTNEGVFNLVMTRVTEEDGEETYTADNIALKAGALVYIEYGKWQGGGQGLYFGVDTNGDGTIDDEYEVEP
jgi:hypothetical protein